MEQASKLENSDIESEASTVKNQQKKPKIKNYVGLTMRKVKIPLIMEPLILVTIDHDRPPTPKAKAKADSLSKVKSATKLPICKSNHHHDPKVKAKTNSKSPSEDKKLQKIPINKNQHVKTQ